MQDVRVVPVEQFRHGGNNALTVRAVDEQDCSVGHGYERLSASARTDALVKQLFAAQVFKGRGRVLEAEPDGAGRATTTKLPYRDQDHGDNRAAIIVPAGIKAVSMACYLAEAGLIALD